MTNNISKIIILTCLVAFAMIFVLALGTSAQTTINEEAGENMNASAVMAAETAENILAKKSILFVGDSLCNGSTDSDKDKYPAWGYAGRFAKFDSMKIQKTGWDGYSMAKCTSAGTIVTQIENNKNNKFDYVLLEGGVNDGWFKAEVGTISDSFDENDFDKTTFAGGFEYTISRAKKYFPDAIFGFLLYFRINNNQGNTNNMKPYWDEAIKICEKWNIPVLDLYFSKDNCKKYELPYRPEENATKLEIYNYNQTIQKVTVDQCHPNGLGYDRLYNAVHDFLIDITVKESEPTAVPTPTVVPETTTAPETTKAPETKAPETKAPVTTEAPENTKAPVTAPETSAESSGLSIGAIIAIAAAAVVAVAGVVVGILFSKKKKA